MYIFKRKLICRKFREGMGRVECFLGYVKCSKILYLF